MKTYKSSTLSNNRAEVLEEAAKNGVIIQEKKTNGDVRREFVLFNVNDIDLVRDWLFDHNLENHKECDDPQCKMCSYDY